jgi:hypothetical protein
MNQSINAFFRAHANSRWVLVFLCAEMIVLFSQGISFYGLQSPGLLDVGIDPVLWLVQASGMIDMLTYNVYIAVLADCILIGLLVFLLIKQNNRWVALALFMLHLCLFALLVGRMGHRNFQTGWIWVLVPFLFTRPDSRARCWSFLRYVLLFFYTSAAIYKWTGGGMTDPTWFQQILIRQQGVYFLEDTIGWRTSLVSWIVQHPYMTMATFWIGSLLELVTLIGFFTKKVDRWILGALVLLHLGIWVLMDIAPIGQLCFLMACLVWKHADEKPSS